MQHWDPNNPYHLHTNDGKVVSFTKDAYDSLTSDLKKQVDDHYNEMNTFENKYKLNPEYISFMKQIQDFNLKTNVNASRGEYWDKNWLDSNYQSGAYSFDDNGLLTYNGKTYAPWGDVKEDKIVVPMRTPNGISYGSNYVYSPVNIPQQYLPVETVDPDYVISVDTVNTLKNEKRDQYIKQNTTRRYPNYLAYYQTGESWYGEPLPKGTSEYFWLNPKTKQPIFKRYDGKVTWPVILKDMINDGLPMDYSYSELSNVLNSYNSFLKNLNKRNYNLHYQDEYNSRKQYSYLPISSEKLDALAKQYAANYYNDWMLTPNEYISVRPGTLQRPSREEIDKAVQLSLDDFNLSSK